MITLYPLIFDPTGWVEVTIETDDYKICHSFHPTQVNDLLALFAQHSIVDPEAIAAVNKWAADYVPETVSPSLQDYEQALDEHLDAVAKADRWRDRFTFVARAAYPNPWQQKAIAFGVWMDECNALAYSHMQAVIEGSEQLIPIQEFIAALPVFTFIEEQA